ncbi:MAG: peptide deformylase [Candidatus Absconditabacteria bacterium]
MTKLSSYIIQTGAHNPILRAPSENVELITDEIRLFCQDLLKLMRKNKGVGLAAPQVGSNIRIIATTQWSTNKRNAEDVFLGETIMINPEILEKSQEYITRKEACISLPDLFGTVKRHKSIVVRYLDLKGHTQKKKLKDFNAVIVQHELDHLDGILFTDKVLPEKSRIKKL